MAACAGHRDACLARDFARRNDETEFEGTRLSSSARQYFDRVEGSEGKAAERPLSAGWPACATQRRRSDARLPPPSSAFIGGVKIRPFGLSHPSPSPFPSPAYHYECDRVRSGLSDRRPTIIPDLAPALIVCRAFPSVASRFSASKPANLNPNKSSELRRGDCVRIFFVKFYDVWQ